MSEIEQDPTIGRENPYWWLWDDHLYLNVVQLAERGWTEWLVRRHLGKPDRWGRVDHWKNWTGKRLYHLSRVELAEDNPEFCEAFRRLIRRNRISCVTVASFIKARIKTKGVADDHYKAMNEDERVKSIRLERFANLLERETPRGRVLANFVGSRQGNREKAP